MCTNNIFDTCSQAWSSPNGPNPGGLPFNRQNCEQLCPSWPGIRVYGCQDEEVRQWCQCNGLGGGPLPSFCSSPPECNSQDKSDVIGACLDYLQNNKTPVSQSNAIQYCFGNLNNNPRFPRAENCSTSQQAEIIGCADYTESNPSAVPFYCNWKCGQPGPCRLCNDASPNVSQRCSGRGHQGYDACQKSCGH